MIPDHYIEDLQDLLRRALEDAEHKAPCEVVSGPGWSCTCWIEEARQLLDG